MKIRGFGHDITVNCDYPAMHLMNEKCTLGRRVNRFERSAHQSDILENDDFMVVKVRKLL